MSDALKIIVTFVVTMLAQLLARKTGVEIDVEQTAGLIATVLAFVLGKQYLAKRRAEAAAKEVQSVSEAVKIIKGGKQ